MEGFNDVWANILNDDLLNAKDLNNVYLLEPRSADRHQSILKVNIEGETSLVESLRPKLDDQSKDAPFSRGGTATLERSSVLSLFS